MNQLVTANERIDFGGQPIPPRKSFGGQPRAMYLEILCNTEEQDEIIKIMETNSDPQPELRRYLADMLEHGAEVDVC